MLQFIQTNAKAIAAVTVIVLFVLYAMSYMTEGMENTVSMSDADKMRSLHYLISRLYTTPTYLVAEDDALIRMLRQDYDAKMPKKEIIKDKLFGEGQDKPKKMNGNSNEFKIIPQDQVAPQIQTATRMQSGPQQAAPQIQTASRTLSGPQQAA